MQSYAQLGSRGSSKAKLAVMMLLGVAAIVGGIVVFNKPANHSQVLFSNLLEGGSVEDQMSFFQNVAQYNKQYKSAEEIKMRFNLFTQRRRFHELINSEQ